MTNRDKINALSNIELAGFLGRNGTNCSLCIYRGKGCRDKSCAFGIKSWLGTPCEENPPADKRSDRSFIEDKELGFHLGNAVKYISRAGRKNPDGTIEDLREAVWYINRQIQRLERGEK